MRVLRLIWIVLLFAGVFQSVDAFAYNVYGSSAVIYDFANNRTRGYSRTQLDYDTAEYYTPYVCGELYKDGVWQVRSCQGGLITATIYTQYTGTAGTASVLSDHYVDMQFFDEGEQSYVDYVGYQFLPGYSYPIDWYFYPAGYLAYYPRSIHLGSTTAIKPKIKITNPPAFNPPSISLGNPSTASALISASPACTGDPNWLTQGDTVVVEIIKDGPAGGTFVYSPAEQNKEMTLALGSDITATFNVTPTTGFTGLPKTFTFTVRVADVRHHTGDTFTSILANVQLDPTNGGGSSTFQVTQ